MKEQLQMLRKQKGLTQKEAAEIFDVKLTTYQKYEIDVISPPYETLIKIADFYGVTTDYLLGREPSQVPAYNFNVENMEENFINAYKQLDEDMRCKLFAFLQSVVEGGEDRPIFSETTCGELKKRLEENQDAEKGGTA